MNFDDIQRIKLRIAKKLKSDSEIEKPELDMETAIKKAQESDKKRDARRNKVDKEARAQLELELMLRDYASQEPVEEVLQKYEELKHDPNKEWDVTKDMTIEYFDPTLSYEITGYRPITETEGLDFDPKLFTVAADNYRNTGRYTNLIPGTFKHKQYWDQEWNRCIKGVTIGRYRLTGENYFWLNYYRLQSVVSQAGEELRNEDFPAFLNKQYEYFHYLELVRILKKDGVAFKSRAVGASEIAASNCAHAYTFHRNSINIVTAFLDDYVSKTLSKVWVQLNFLNTQTDGEFRHVRMKIDTEDHKRASKVDRDKNESGWMSEIVGMLHDKPRKLRGDRVYSLYFEEAGSDPMLETAYVQSEALVKIGGKRCGSRFVFGTGGDSGPALEALKKMFYNPESFKVLPYKNNYSQDGKTLYTGYFIPSYTMWFGDDTKGIIGFDERGVVNEKLAKEYYEAEFKAIQDSHLLTITKAEFCFTPEDAFILEGENRFDQELLVDQLQAITLHKTVEKPRAIRLSWGHKDDSSVDRDSMPQVEFVSDGPIKIAELPMRDPYGIPYNNLYVAGIDSIDSDSTTSTGQTDVSSFCMVILRRAFGLLPPKVVAIYKERPLHIQTAFDTAIKLCQFYNCKALFEATRVSIKTHFERYGKLSMLMRRPKASSNTSTKTNLRQFGVPANEAIIDHQLDLIEQYIVDYSDTMQFPDMIDELMRYSYANKRKFDIVAAFGICLLADEEIQGRVAKPVMDYSQLFGFSFLRNKYGQIEYKFNDNDLKLTFGTTNLRSDRSTISPHIYKSFGGTVWGQRGLYS